MKQTEDKINIDTNVLEDLHVGQKIQNQLTIINPFN
jgi:predicted nucleic acid-binding protein